MRAEFYSRGGFNGLHSFNNCSNATPETSGCALIWREGLCRCKQAEIKQNEIGWALHRETVKMRRGHMSYSRRGQSTALSHTLVSDLWLPECKKCNSCCLKSPTHLCSPVTWSLRAVLCMVECHMPFLILWDSKLASVREKAQRGSGLHGANSGSNSASPNSQPNSKKQKNPSPEC